MICVHLYISISENEIIKYNKIGIKMLMVFNFIVLLTKKCLKMLSK